MGLTNSMGRVLSVPSVMEISLRFLGWTSLILYRLLAAGSSSLLVFSPDWGTWWSITIWFFLKICGFFLAKQQDFFVSCLGHGWTVSTVHQRGGGDSQQTLRCLTCWSSAQDWNECDFYWCHCREWSCWGCRGLWGAAPTKSLGCRDMLSSVLFWEGGYCSLLGSWYPFGMGIQPPGLCWV